LKNSGDVLYEIILADDNSTDDTQLVERFVKNIRVIKNKKNNGFLFNCNNAAKFAKGKYVLFLNNDTYVQPGWLFWLVKTLEEKPDVGMVGAKLVFSTGKLQEAGGVVFKDGSAMNYGRGDDPDKPQYNYLKDVDYCSGACICVRCDIWKKLNGFDPQFAPAYYEDTDLAMRVRSLGYRTVYQPNSMVVHSEGISHGTDITKGIKKKQDDNQKIFYSKWAVELDRNNYDRDENLFKARDKSKHKQTVLIIDHSVPSASDHNEKSKQMINHFCDLNFNIKFLPDNFLRPAHDSVEREQAGVEILYGEYYRENWPLWIGENAEYIDSICFVDESLANKYLPILKSKLGNSFQFIIYNQIN
jgi:glycosyltransferase involved in cell wall biosynthesis